MAFNPQRNPASSARDDWETPSELFGALHSIFRFTVDACATAQNAKLGRFWDPTEDGLSKSWAGETVWCNPPYSNWAAWAEKADHECHRNSASVVMLIPPRTDAKAWHEFTVGSDYLVFLQGRVSFLEDSRPRSGNPAPSALLVWDPRSQYTAAVRALGLWGPETHYWDWKDCAKARQAKEAQP